MATITMDTSEYEALQKNIKLLEESKEREQKLNDEIQILNKEKISILEKASHSVVITNRTTKTELIYQRRPMRDILVGLQSVMNDVKNQYGQRQYEEHLDKYVGDIIDKCFTKTEVKGESVEPTVVTRGLDEYKVEFKKEYFETLDKEVKSELERARKAQENYSELSTKFRNQTSINEINQTVIKNLEKEAKDYKDLENQKYEQIQKIKSYYYQVVDLLENFNIFNYVSKITRVKSILRDISKDLHLL